MCSGKNVGSELIELLDPLEMRYHVEAHCYLESNHYLKYGGIDRLHNESKHYYLLIKVIFCIVD